jgi:hypothetical protein
MKKTCNICYGSGQINSFKGESRFHLSVDDCPVCCGLGFVISSDDESEDTLGSNTEQVDKNNENKHQK